MCFLIGKVVIWYELVLGRICVCYLIVYYEYGFRKFKMLWIKDGVCYIWFWIENYSWREWYYKLFVDFLLKVKMIVIYWEIFYRIYLDILCNYYNLK